MDIVNDLKIQIASYYDELVILIPRIFIAFVVAISLYIVLTFIKSKLIKAVARKSDDKLLADFARSILQMVIVIFITLLFLYIIGLKGIAGSILGAASLSAFVIGFALKDIGENFLAGVIMAFDRPFRLGDTIKTGEVEGSITAISLRDTHIKTFDGKDVFVPNGQIIKNPLYNYTIDGFLRGNFTVGVDYETDIEETRKIIMSVLENISGILKDDKPPRTHVKNLNTSTIDIEIHYWINTFDKQYSGLELKSIIQTKVIQALSSKNIGMPSNIIELKNYDKEFNTKQETVKA